LKEKHSSEPGSPDVVRKHEPPKPYAGLPSGAYMNSRFELWVLRLIDRRIKRRTKKAGDVPPTESD
jgi:hypothetical protein